MHPKSMIIGAAGAVTVTALALGGAALASAGPASAPGYAVAGATGAPTGAPGAPGPGKGRGHGRDGAPGQHKDISQHALTGDTAVKVTQAAVAKEPTAYLLRVGKATDGTYRAHMMRPDGTHIMLTIDANFAVTSVADAPAPGPKGKPRPTVGPTSTSSAT